MYMHTANQLNEAAGLPSGKVPASPARTMPYTSHGTSIASRRSVTLTHRLLLDANTAIYRAGLASGGVRRDQRGSYQVTVLEAH